MSLKYARSVSKLRGVFCSFGLIRSNRLRFMVDFDLGFEIELSSINFVLIV